MPIVNVDILEASVATPPSGSTTLFTDAGALKVKKDTGAVDVITEHRADNLTGTTLADNVVNSLLTSVGTLGVLGVTGTVTAGSFSGPLTGNVTGNVSGTSGSTTGNAATATALQTPRAINGTNFDGTAPITITAAAGTLTGNTLAAGVTASSLTSLGTLTSLTTSGSAGVGVSPSVRMHVKGTSAAEVLRIETPNARGAGAVYASFYDSTGRKAYVGYGAASDVLFLMNEMANSIHIGTNALNRLVIDGSGNVSMPTDSVELRIGAGNDLRFSHDGTNSIIENNTGVLRILSGGDLRLEEGQVALQTVGKGLSIKEGTNAKQGLTGNLVAGSLVVSNTSVTANSRIQLTRETSGGTLGHISYSKIAGVSFTITSTSATETSTFVYSIFEVS